MHSHNFINLINKKYNRLYVIGIDKDKSTNKVKYWLCKCECGNIISVRGDHLRDGSIKSCGCLKHEPSVIKRNRIEFDSNLGCLRVYFNNCDEYFLCDIEDRDIAEKYCWYKSYYGYVVCNIINENGVKTITQFHRLVMKKYNGNISDFIIDHVNHNKLDNRKYNLRLCNYSENGRNKIYRLSNVNEKHIYYNNHENKYIFQLSINGKYYSYRFDSLDNAILYRDNFYKEHPDEFRYDSSSDIRNKNNEDVIHPFTFINPFSIIQPFQYLN